MTRGVVPAVERHADIVLVASAHHAFQPLVEFVRVVSADALHPHLASVFTYLLGLGDELSFLSALWARLYGIYVFWKIEASRGHNKRMLATEASGLVFLAR